MKAMRIEESMAVVTTGCRLQGLSYFLLTQKKYGGLRDCAGTENGKRR